MMRGGFEWQVAWRFLREGRFQTVLIVTGVAAGVAVIAYITALVTGLQANTIAKTVGTQAHVSVQPPEEVVLAAADVPPHATVMPDTQVRTQRLRSIAGWQQLLTSLEADKRVTAVSPVVSGPALALRGQASGAVTLTGVQLDRHDRIIGLRSRVVSGAASLEPGEAIIGLDLAQDLGVRPGDRLAVQTGTSVEPLRVTALVDLGSRELNRRTLFVPLRTAQSLLGLPGGATQLQLVLADAWLAPVVAGELRARLAQKVESWQEVNAQLVTALRAQSVSTYLIRLVVAIVVVLGIASVLVVSVIQKRREIGILRAMGATRGQVLRVFLLQGFAVAALGSLAGVALARAMIFLFTHFVRGADGLPLFVIGLPLATALQAAALAMAGGLLAAIAPARRAARMDPAEAIRL